MNLIYPHSLLSTGHGYYASNLSQNVPSDSAHCQISSVRLEIVFRHRELSSFAATSTVFYDMISPISRTVLASSSKVSISLSVTLVAILELISSNPRPQPTPSPFLRL